MQWSSTWHWVLMSIALAAFALGLCAASVALAWTRQRSEECASEAVLEHFLRGYNAMTLALNALGLLLATTTIFLHVRLLSRFADVVWMLKDFVLALALSAAILSLLALRDVHRAHPQCSTVPTARALQVLESCSVLVYGSYILLRIVMAFLPRALPALQF